MNKAMRELKELSPIVDIFIVVLDSRCPLSSYNHDFDNLKPSASRLFIISKIDLGDKSKFNRIKNALNAPNSEVLFLDLRQRGSKKRVLDAIKRLLRDAPKRLLGLPKIAVIGPPNSGKSTLIKLLSEGKRVAIGNEAGVTRRRQWISLKGNFDLLDTPGILWPKHISREVFGKLMIAGALKKSSFDIDQSFNEVYKSLSRYYPEKVVELGLIASEEEDMIYNLLFGFAKSKGFLQKSGEVDRNRAMDFIIERVRSMEGITLE